MAILAEENQQLKKVSHKNESNEEYNALIGLL